MINDAVLDLALQDISSRTNALHMCTQMPTTYTEAVLTYSMGYKANPVLSNPTVRPAGGRRIYISQILDGIVTKNATATHYALVDTNLQVLKATEILYTPQELTTTAPFTLEQFDISLID